MKKAPLSCITTSTSEYEFTHGKKPKGCGNWAFLIKGETHWIYGTYKDANSAAKRIAQQLGTYTVKVLT